MVNFCPSPLESKKDEGKDFCVRLLLSSPVQTIESGIQRCLMSIFFEDSPCIFPGYTQYKYIHRYKSENMSYIAIQWPL